jgi:hypothetical protein
MAINPLSNMHDYILDIISNSVIKYKYKELENETLEMTMAADKYMDALLEADNFYTHLHYEPELLLSPEANIVGLITDPDRLEAYEEDRRNIPEEYHDILLELKRKKIIEEYDEPNNYYREMIGLPPLDSNGKVVEDDVIYVDQAVCDKYGLDSSIPLHKQSDATIMLLEGNGIIDDLIEKYPDKTYLKFLGDDKISLVTARRSKDYALIKVPLIDNRTLLERFSNIYDQCREYVVTTIFVPELRDVISYYDNFIAMIIMLHAITQTFARLIKTSLRREYYDSYCTKLLYSVYGVPYHDQLDSDYQKAITQYLNILVLNKGTNTTLFDVSSLLGYDRLKIYKYYLMKDRLIDSKGLPITIYDEDGNEDLKQMYDVYFSKIPLDEADFRRAIINKSNRCEYDDVTSGDPFWYEEDKALYEQLYETEYNYYESKYLGLEMSYRLSEIMFESVYLINMIFDKKDELQDLVTIEISKVTNSTEPVTIFDATVALCAAICKYHNMKGNILYEPSQILHILGFNFDLDWNVIQQMVADNPFYSQALYPDGTNRILAAVVPIECVSKETLNQVYDNHIGLMDYLVDKMATTQDIEEYRAYRKLYETIYIKDENIKSFTVNGYVPTTYLDYLKYANYKLYSIISNASKSDLYKYIQHLIYKLCSVFTNVDYIHISTDDTSPVQEALISLVKFFKSYTTDLVKFDIIYILNWKPELLLRLIDRIQKIDKTIIPKEYFNFSYDDSVFVHSRLINPEVLNTDDKIRTDIKAAVTKDNLNFRDTCRMVY